MSATARRVLATLFVVAVCVGALIANRWSELTVWWSDYSTDTLRAMASILLAPVFGVCISAAGCLMILIWTVDRSAKRIALHSVGVVVSLALAAGVGMLMNTVTPEEWAGLVFIGGVALCVFLLFLFGDALDDLPLPLCEEEPDDDKKADSIGDMPPDWATVSRRMRTLHKRP